MALNATPYLHDPAEGQVEMPRKRNSRFRFLSKTTFLIQVIIFYGLFRITILNHSYSVAKLYPILSDSREHFINSIGHFTLLKFSDPAIANRDYLNAKGLTSEEKIALKFFVADYVIFHKKNRNLGNRKLIFIPNRIGLGDRVSCMIFAYWTAVVTKRVFLVNWQHPFPLKHFLKGSQRLDLFVSEKEVEKMAGSKAAYLNQTEASLKSYERVLSSDIDIIVMKTNRIPGRFSKNFLADKTPKGLSEIDVQGMRWNVNLHRAILHHIFTLSNSMKKEHVEMSNRMKLSPQALQPRRGGGIAKVSTILNGANKRRPYISVHARIGVGVGEEPAGRFKEIGRKMKIAALCLASRAVRVAYMSGSPALPIFLATDTPEFRTIFETVVRNISHNRVNVLNGQWGVTHLNKLLYGRSLTRRDIERDRKVVRNSYMDLLMLGHSQHIIALYSSFPRLAFALGNAESIVELKNEVCLEKDKWT